MKGQTQIGGIDFHYWKEDNFLHVKASDIVYQDCILPEEIKSIIDLMKSSELTRLLLNYEEGFVAEILQLDDRPNLYKLLQVPLDFRFAFYTKKKLGDILYFNRVLEESDYNTRWFTDLDKAKGWLLQGD